MSTADSWFEVYKAALLETDCRKLPERIQAAESKLDERQRVLSADHGGTPEERLSIADALRGLAVLRKEATEWQARQVPAQVYQKHTGLAGSVSESRSNKPRVTSDRPLENGRHENRNWLSIPHPMHMTR